MSYLMSLLADTCLDSIAVTYTVQNKHYPLYYYAIVLATKIVIFSGPSHQLIIGTDDSSLTGAWVIIKVLGVNSTCG